MSKVTTRRIKKADKDPIKRAIKYYTIVSCVNDIHLTKAEIEVVAFCSVRGNVSSAGAKIEFSKAFNRSVDTLSNMVAKLRRLGFLVKDPADDLTKVNPFIALDPDSSLIINVLIPNE